MTKDSYPQIVIRIAGICDISAVADIYALIHEHEKRGIVSIGWDPEVYPVKATAEKALVEDSLDRQARDVREETVGRGGGRPRLPTGIVSLCETCHPHSTAIGSCRPNAFIRERRFSNLMT